MPTTPVALTELVTDVGTFITGSTGWFAKVLAYLTSAEVWPFVLLGLGIIITGFAFKYVRSLVKG